MRKVFISSFFLTLCTVFSVVSFGQEPTGPLDGRLQIEGSFATALEGDAGFNFNVNYAPQLPGSLDRILAIGAFWQWTFNGDDFEGIGSDANLLKLGGEIRLQKGFFHNSIVPYIKAEAEWLRFDNSESEDKFGIGPGFGINFWTTPTFGFGSELNTVFVVDNGDLDDQITTLMVGPRIRF